MYCCVGGILVGKSIGMFWDNITEHIRSIDIIGLPTIFVALIMYAVCYSL